MLKYINKNKDTVVLYYLKRGRIDNINGNFNVIITNNSMPIIKFDDDIDAWQRRILLIKYNQEKPKMRNIIDY